MRTAYATFVRNWIITRRAYPWSFAIGSLLTGIYAVGLAYLTYHALAGGETGAEFVAHTGTADYMSFVIIGVAVDLFAVRILLDVSRSLITEKRQGTLESLLLAPASRLSYLTAVAFQGAVTCLVEMSVMLLVAWPLGLHLDRVNVVSLALVLPVATVGLIGTAFVLGALMLATGDTYLSQNTLFVFMALVCGFTFPPQYLPPLLQWMGKALPITGALHLIRQAVLEGVPPRALFPSLLLNGLLGAGFMFIGYRWLGRAERRALEGV